MLECIRFLLTQCINVLNMLFSIDLGFTSLGVLLCIIYILLPLVLFCATYFKHMVVEEIDERYDESRPINITTSSFHEHHKLGDGKSYHYSNVVQKRRRMRK